MLNLIDEFTRKCLAIQPRRRLNSRNVIEVVANAMIEHGIPEHIRSDNGPEFVAKDLRKWLADIGTKTLYIEPGSPWENGYCESFNSKLRDEFLNGEIFYSLKEVQVLAERWRVYYNTVRPHSSLGYRPPAPAARQMEDNAGHGKVESKERFPLFHTPDCGGIGTKPLKGESEKVHYWRGQGEQIPLRAPYPLQRLQGRRLVHLRSLYPHWYNEVADCP